MDNKKINEFLNKIVLDKFILNFVPGLILYYVLTMFVNISIGEGLTSLLIVTTVSWVLGLLLELAFFHRTYMQRREGEILSTKNQLNLLFGKIGVCVVIACVFWVDLEWVLDMFDNRNEEEMRIIRPIVKMALLTSVGLLLIRYYKKNKTKKS